jgi:hypothetical protein
MNPENECCWKNYSRYCSMGFRADHISSGTDLQTLKAEEEGEISRKCADVRFKLKPMTGELGLI